MFVASWHVSNRGNEYWKLLNHKLSHNTKAYNKAVLNNGNYKFPASATVARLAEMMNRCERGFLSYDGCQPRELKTFCIQRSIQIPGAGKTTKAQLVEVLEAADEQAEFSRFQDLAPELRVNIYKLYFLSLPMLEEPTQPPISKVLRLIRQESLPVFFETTTFIVKIIKNPWWNSVFNEPEYFSNMPENHIKKIRSLSIRNYDWQGPGADKVVTWNRGKVSFSTSNNEPIDKPSAVGQDIGVYLGSLQGNILTNQTIPGLQKFIPGSLRLV